MQNVSDNNNLNTGPATDAVAFELFRPEDYPAEQRALIEEFNLRAAKGNRLYAQALRSAIGVSKPTGAPSGQQDEAHQINVLHKLITEFNDIISGAGLGVWHIILQDGAKPRMQVSNKMAELLGIEGLDLSEEAIYDSWYQQIVPDSLPSVQASVQEMLDGSFSENTYQWRHPKKGLIYVRCGGSAKHMADGSTILSGYHADVSKIVRKEQNQKRALNSAMNKLSQAFGMVKGFSQDFHTIWVVNKETAQMQLIRSSGKNTIQDAVQLGLDYPDFDTACERYVDHFVAPDSKKKMYAELQFDNILEHLTQENVYSINYMRCKDGTIDYHQITFANADTEDGKPQFVLGFRDVDSVMRAELAQKQALEEAKDLAEKHTRELSKQLEIINTIAKVYKAIYYIDLRDGSFVQLGDCLPGVNAVIGESGNAREAFERMLEHLIIPEHVEVMREFTDLTTLTERLKDKEWISHEFCGTFSGWSNGIFVAANRNERQECEQAIWATFDIDAIKKTENELIYKSNTDELTQAFNRRAYENTLKAYANEELNENLVYVAMDINGLKHVNDTLGHDAGDELIIAAAGCMKHVLGAYGKLFRIGGDEFSAIIIADDAQLATIQANIEEITAKWHGKLVDSLAISCGFVSAHEFPGATLKELGHIADERMYANKKAYYKARGIEHSYM